MKPVPKGRRLPDRRVVWLLAAAAAVVALVTVATATAVSTRQAVAPSNNSLPTIGGSATTGSTLSANPGTWNGSTPITFQYQWRICGGSGEACHDIAGATSQTYVLKRDDAGNTVRIHVIASNSDGSANATSAPSARIAVPAGPTNTVPPAISGNATVNGTLTTSNGTWTGATPITFTYQWTLCGEDGEACQEISGATAQTYKPKSADVGKTVRARVSARNSDGTTSATSVPSAKIGSGSSGGSGGATCPTPPAGTQTVPVEDMSLPMLLQVAGFQVTSGTITKSTQQFTARFRVTDTCGHPVSGALVYATAVPYNQFTIPAEPKTDNTGWATMTFQRLGGFPASAQQQQLTMFVRARKQGEPVLSGIAARRLIAFAMG
jgi:hypothetical protein